MYYAKGIVDLIRASELSIEFFRLLDDFQVQYIEMCFKKDLEDTMGMIGEVERYNYHIFREFKQEIFYEKHGIYEEWWKKVA